ncbi:hypothetical protein [Microcoleus sp. bin38.metabat.b11b12b14.051]|nr:hypothetical protein [Microcoleus sp. bin38.metabat.b11b12b14.051]
MDDRTFGQYIKCDRAIGWEQDTAVRFPERAIAQQPKFERTFIAVFG